MKKCIFALIMLLSFASSAEAACNVQRFRFQFGTDTATTMKIVGGGWCRINLNAGGTSVFEKFETVQPPRNGKVTIENKSQVVYAVAKGFKGNDNFIVRVTGHGSQISGSVNISVAVVSE